MRLPEYTPLPRRYCDFHGERLAYVKAGHGPAVLLIHGLGGTADFWRPLVARLISRRTVI
jgi:pimeloyl-ACP methyl ester carboxylesterase